MPKPKYDLEEILGMFIMAGLGTLLWAIAACVIQFFIYKLSH